jgi:hypothetical protein
LKKDAYRRITLWIVAGTVGLKNKQIIMKPTLTGRYRRRSTWTGSCATESLRIKNDKTSTIKLLTASLLDIHYSLE